MFSVMAVVADVLFQLFYRLLNVVSPDASLIRTTSCLEMLISWANLTAARSMRVVGGHHTLGDILQHIILLLSYICFRFSNVEQRFACNVMC